jgi:hypothetical protein
MKERRSMISCSSSERTEDGGRIETAGIEVSGIEFGVNGSSSVVWNRLSKGTNRGGGIGGAEEGGESGGVGARRESIS